jgi:hypothetical protein
MIPGKEFGEKLGGYALILAVRFEIKLSATGAPGQLNLRVRRRWPARLISWSRLLAGGFRDPLVGRDVLVGCLLATFGIAIENLGWFVPSWLGHLLRVLLRKQWAAAIAFVLLFTVFYSSTSQFAPVLLVNNLIVTGLTVFVLIRLGLLALVTTWVFVECLNFPLTTQGSAWYAGISLTGILLMAAMAFYGFYTSLGGRPVFGGAVLEE